MKIRSLLLLVLVHTTLILSLAFLILLVLDFYNPMMGFLVNPISQRLFALFCIFSAGLSVKTVCDIRQISKKSRN